MEWSETVDVVILIAIEPVHILIEPALCTGASALARIYICSSL
jgi:hypothetical protein